MLVIAKQNTQKQGNFSRGLSYVQSIQHALVNKRGKFACETRKDGRDVSVMGVRQQVEKQCV